MWSNIDHHLAIKHRTVNKTEQRESNIEHLLIASNHLHKAYPGTYHGAYHGAYHGTYHGAYYGAYHGAYHGADHGAYHGAYIG